MMDYKIVNRMVSVDFHANPLPPPPKHILAALFVGRELTFNADGWIGITCFKQEWMDFLDAMVKGLSLLSDQESSAAVAGWRSEYIQFLAKVGNGPFAVM